MTAYPSSIKSFTALTDGIDDVLASHHNDAYNEITAIETELGANPKTIDDTVAPAAPASVAAYLDMLANIVKTQSGSTTWTNAAAAAIMKSIGTTKGDLIAFSGSATPVRLAGSTTDGDVLTRGSTETAGVKWLALPYASNTIGFTPGGRLTLTSGSPVTSTDVTGSTSVYYTPCVHNCIELWTDSVWQALTFSESTLSVGTVTSGLLYDVFGYLNSGALAVEKLAWTNATTRATGVSLQDGRYCKTGDKTRLYLGTFCASSTAATEDSAGGTHQTGGKRFLWNMYNRRPRPLAVIDTTDNWSYTTATIRQANGAAGNKVEFILGLAEDQVEANASVVVYLTGNSTKGGQVGVGLDATNAYTGLVGAGYNNNAAPIYTGANGNYRGIPAVGYHYLAWLEKGADGTTCLFLGDNGADGVQSGLYATVWA